MKKVRWCHQVLSFYVLPFATTQVCPALFQKPQLLFLPSRPFSTRLATALCSRLLQEAGLDPFHISSRPLRISDNYKMSDCSEEVWGESADSFSDFSWEISKRGVALESGSQCMRILPKSLLETVFEKRGTLNWIEPLLWRRSCENPLMDWRSSWWKGDWSQAWTWFRNFRICDFWIVEAVPGSLWNHFGVLWQVEILPFSVREARVPSVFGRQG